jgi:hypothetical protein
MRTPKLKNYFMLESNQVQFCRCTHHNATSAKWEACNSETLASVSKTTVCHNSHQLNTHRREYPISHNTAEFLVALCLLPRITQNNSRNESECGSVSCILGTYSCKLKRSKNIFVKDRGGI